MQATQRNVSLQLFGTVVSMLLCAGLGAQDAKKSEPENVAARLQPDVTALGTLRKGTRVESNIIVFWNDPATKAEKAVIEPPAFIRILRSSTRAHPQHGMMTRVWFAIDTSKLGAHDGQIDIRYGDAKIKAPVSAVVLPNDRLSPRVLVAETPFEGYSTSTSTTFDAWRHLVATKKLEVHYIGTPKSGEHVLRAEDVSRVDVLLLGESSLIQLTESDVSLVQGFVCGGGRVIVTASSFFVGTVPAANKVLRPFGLQMNTDRGRGNLQALDEDLAKHPLTAKVESITARTPCGTRIEGAQSGQVLVNMPGELAFVALARSAAGGEVVTIGTSLWWKWIGEAKGNSRLLGNLLARPRRTTSGDKR